MRVNCVKAWFWVGHFGQVDKLLGLLITEVFSIPYIRETPDANQDKSVTSRRGIEGGEVQGGGLHVREA